MRRVGDGQTGPYDRGVELLTFEQALSDHPLWGDAR